MYSPIEAITTDATTCVTHHSHTSGNWRYIVHATMWTRKSVNVKSTQRFDFSTTFDSRYALPAHNMAGSLCVEGIVVSECGLHEVEVLTLPPLH